MSKLTGYPRVVYFGFFLLVSAWAVFQPMYTWDVLGYIGCSVESSDPRDIHRLTYGAIRNVASAKNMLADNPYHADLVANPYHFAEQLPFYSIKPIYVLLIKALHRLGIPFPTATAAVSAASNFALALILWRWLAVYLNGLTLAVTCSLIMLSPNILVLSRWAVPDCLSMVVAAAGLFLILERKVYFWGSFLLLLNVWVRTDALILAGAIFAVLLFCRKLDTEQFVLLSLLGVGSYFAIIHFAGNYGWSALFHNSFMGGLVAPGETVVRVTYSSYFRQLVRGAYLFLVSGAFSLYMLLGALAIWLNRSSLYSYIIAAVLAARGLSYLLFPNGDQRYMAVLYVLIPVSLVVAVSGAAWGVAPRLPTMVREESHQFQ